MTDQYRDWIIAEGFDKPSKRRGSALPPRKRPTLADKVAALLLLMPPRGDGTPLIPADVRAKGRAAILAYPLHWDHIIARGLCGTDTHDNYRPMHPADHKPKTRADKKLMAHNDRLQLTREQQEYVDRKCLEFAGLREQLRQPKKRKWGSRPMPGSKASKWRKTMRGKVELR